MSIRPNREPVHGPKVDHTASLYTWLSDVSEDSFREDVLDEVLRKMGDTPGDSSFDAQASWEKIVQKAKKPQKKHFQTLRLRTLLAAATLMVLLVGALTAQAMGADIFSAIVRWTEDTFWFARHPTVIIVEDTSPDIELGWVPEGYLCVEMSEVDGFLFKAYSGASEGEWFTISSYDCSNNATVFEKDDSAISVEDDGNTKYYCFRNLGNLSMVWQLGSREYSLTGSLDAETLLHIAQNIDERDGKPIVSVKQGIKNPPSGLSPWWRV